MATRLIQLDDGILMEVDVSGDQVEQISGRLANRVESSFAGITPVLTSACRSIVAAWSELDADMDIEAAEIALGLSFESEGNIYITKARGSANITLTLTLKPTR